MTIDALMDELRQAGQRATVARRAVLEELLAAGETHLTAEELARQVRAEHPAIHLSTVYRTLDSLTDAGIIAPARLADHPATYHLTGDVHHHAVCTRCEAVISLPATMFEPVRTRLRRDHGFRADPHHLTITGLCASCAAEA